ncbi:Replication initiation/membrane attachment protein [Candidatus Phytoplasma australiense]|uniref:Replication initiation/membrane attachment protein n=2 Tax=Phytoplasma australiense TaxID=59748 RepID=B1VB33_PHYAS|nr:replication initiation protein [Candidatus Phytoplasma australiense]CAM12156.1 Replication initiation/membrane attachment protein [Candidatus Phytoplasma australiense]
MISNRFTLFKIKNQISLSFEDHQTLSLLYQPLIGAQALSIYYILLSLKANFEYQHQFLFDIAFISEDVFLEQKEKLEALNLLATYQKENPRETIYLVFPPYKSNAFLQDPLLGDFLLSEMGEKNYFHLESHFLLKPLNLEGFQDISKKFDDIYQFEKINFNQNIQQHKTMNPFDKSFLQSNFDYEAFLSSLPERFKKTFLVESQTIDFINKLSLVYNLTPQKIAEIYQNTFPNPNDIDLSKLRLNVKKNYHQNNKEQIIISSKKTGYNEEEMITFLKKPNATQRIIKGYCQKSNQTIASDTVFQLLERNDLEIGLVNALLIYILRYHNGILPSVVYLEKTLKSWSQKGILDAETAYDFLMEEKTEKQVNFKKPKDKPKWIDEIKKNWQS